MFELIGAEHLGEDSGGGGLFSMITPILSAAGTAVDAGLKYKVFPSYPDHSRQLS